MASSTTNWECDQCNKTFATWVELACHDRWDHRHSKVGDGFICGVKCEGIECAFWTRKYSEFREHMDSAHIGVMFCRHCDEGFLCSKRLTEHEAKCTHAHCEVGKCPLMECDQKKFMRTFMKKVKD